MLNMLKSDHYGSEVNVMKTEGAYGKQELIQQGATLKDII
jgi:hypothetical protein